MRILFLLAIFSQPVFAKTVVLKTDGTQVVIEGAPVFEETERVIWDEKIHGPLPAADDYSIVAREEYEQKGVPQFRLVVDSEKKKSVSKKALLVLKAKIDNETATAAEVRKALKYLLSVQNLE